MDSDLTRLARCAVWHLARVVHAPIGMLGQSLIVAVAKYRSLDGMPVGVLDRRGAGELWARLGQALALVESTAPRQYVQVKRDIRRIVVHFGDSAECSLSSFTCFLGNELVRRSDAAMIASILVHEATHARLYRSGVPYAFRSKTRIEALCFREEIIFASKLPRDRFPNIDAYLSWLRRQAERHA